MVKGLLALIAAAVEGRARAEIGDLRGMFKDLGIEENLSVSRRNGLASLLEKLTDF